MKSRPTPSDRVAVQREQGSGEHNSLETIPPRPFHDPLLLTIIGTAIILSGLIFMMYLSWGSGQALGDTPWYIPVTHSFAALAAFSVAFLAFGRYPVLRDAASYWIGIGFAMYGIWH